MLHHCNCSTRVSNELGAGRPRAARLALFVMVIMSVLEGLVVAMATILVRYSWGRLYSNDKEVVSYVGKMMPLLAVSDFLDGFQCVLSGISVYYTLVFHSIFLGTMACYSDLDTREL